MFRMIFKNSDWKWQAFGKHPSESEYLRPAHGSPLQLAVFSWMEQGFDRLPEELKSVQGLAWSFWMKGPNGKLLCGRLSSSRDRFGRMYPLMLIGEGIGGDTVNHWDLIPFACQDSWQMLQDVALADSEELSPLQERLGTIQPPMVDWKKQRPLRDELRDAKVVFCDPSRSRYLQKLNGVDALIRNPVFSLPLDDEHFDNCYLPSFKFLSLLRKRVMAEPNMVFLGGSAESQAVTVLKFPPRVQDFVMLWENAERGRHGL